VQHLEVVAGQESPEVAMEIPAGIQASAVEIQATLVAEALHWVVRVVLAMVGSLGQLEPMEQLEQAVAQDIFPRSPRFFP
jgi:hypothetical protein